MAALAVAVPTARAAAPPSPGEEVRSLATGQSRSFEQRDGTIVQRIYGDPVNVKDHRGAWQHIDTSLKPTASGALEPVATATAVSIPRRLEGGPLSVGPQGGAVSLAPLALHGEAAAAGDSAVFREAADGLDATFSALPTGVKQTYVLRDESAPDHIDVAMRVSNGLSVKPGKQGGASVVDDSGASRYELSPTFGWAKGLQPRRVLSRVSRKGDAYVLRIDLSAAWIRTALRSGPVAIDPTLTVPSPTSDAAMGGTAGASDATGVLEVGGAPRQSLVRFDLGSVPDDARVLDATVALHTLPSGFNTDSSSQAIQLHEVTSDWDGPYVTATQRKAGTSWLAFGGDFKPAPEANAPSVRNLDGWVTWRPTALVQRWVSGTSQNFGFMLRHAFDGTNVTTSFASRTASGANAAFKPYIQVRYAPAAGQRRDDTYLTQQLSDRSTLGIGVASGNALLSSKDISIAGMAQPLALTRSYNTGLVNHRTGAFGNGGTGALTGDVRLSTLADESAALHLGDGAVYRFKKVPSGYEAATRLEADLVRKADLTYELTYRRSQGKWRFGADGRLTQIVDKNGNAVTLAYGANGALATITDSQGRQLPVTVNATGQITRISDPTGRAWGYTYGGTAGDRLTAYTDPENKQTRYLYDTSNRLKRITTAGGRITLLSYDADSRVDEIVRVTNPDDESGPTTRLRYDQSSPRCTGALAGKATIVTDPRGNDTTYCVDDKLRVVTTVDALGHEQATSYTSQGQVQSFTDGAGTGSRATTRTYATSTNNLTAVKGPMNETTALTYKPGATRLVDLYRPQSVTSPDGQQSWFDYDDAGNVSSVRDAQSGAQQQATMSYNGNGTIATAKDGENRTTSYTYYQPVDGGYRGGLLRRLVPPLPRNPTVFDYDQLGRVVSVTDGNAKLTTYTYDKLDRVSTIVFAGGSSLTYTYDADGNQTQRADSAAGTYDYTYDDLNRRIGETLPGGRSVFYAYDSNGNLTSLTDGSGVTGYGYDEVNQNCYVAPAGLGGAPCGSAPSGAIRMTYNAMGDRIRTQFTSAAFDFTDLNTTFDAGGKPTQTYIYAGASGGVYVPLDRSYTYSPGQGRIVGTRDDDSEAGTTHESAFGYDPSGRLASESVGAYDFREEKVTLSYDKAGNRTALTTTLNGQAGPNVKYGTNKAYSYNAANQQSPNSATDYDPQGNRLAGLAYNARNQTTTFGATTLAYGGPNQQELIAAGGKIVENNLLGVGRVIDSSGAAAFIRDSDGTILARKAPNGTWSAYAVDPIGSVIYGPGGVKRYDMDGNVRNGSDVQDFGFAGSYAVKNASGDLLYHNGLRWYDPKTARWTQPDPLDQPGDLQNANPYLYVGSDPINNVDPTGESILGDGARFVKRRVVGAWKGAEKGASIGGRAGAAGGCAAGSYASGGTLAGCAAGGVAGAGIGGFLGTAAGAAVGGVAGSD